MAISGEERYAPAGGDSAGGKLWNLCRMPFRQVGGAPAPAPPSSSGIHYSSGRYGHEAPVAGGGAGGGAQGASAGSISSVAKSLLPARRRLRLDPANKLYFPYEPGNQFQTTAPKSCFMRPPGAILSPGETIIATVFKFVEQPENNENVLQKCKVKFKILSLKVQGPMEYAPELFDEQKDQAVVEKILRVVFLATGSPCPQLEKLKNQLAEAEAALEARKKPPEENGPKIVGEGLVIDEWKERRERYLAQQQVEVADSV
ncbi:vesicle-associated protein 4-2-like isoform X2 [Phragmites australis]|uniref:vesicle-associated protein 4-2-like isoform X2 n=1 Tax=Phragmites australis TaxID=29695 RepID=UPI002D77D02C|nr:vesicle-associated protein 4-2-like isoform X2 [Phragmites australis]